MKNLTSICLGLVLLTACAKKEADPQPAAPVLPAPIQEATLNLRFDYYGTIKDPSATRSLSLLATRPAGQQFTDRLTLHFDNLDRFNTITDQLDFVLPRSRHKAGLVGTYSLASQPDAGVGDAQVSYVRPIDAGAVRANVFTSSISQLTGSLTITTYDAARQLVSGSYSLSLDSVKDPFSFTSAGLGTDSRRDGDLRLSGTFQEVPLK